MNALAIGGISFLCVFGGALAGMVLRTRLREYHLSEESRDIVKMGAGLIATLTALVLGLLVASAKASFDTQSSEVRQVAANVILLDRALAHYGPEAKEARELLRNNVADAVDRIWPAESSRAAQVQPSGGSETLYDKLQGLAPKNESQRSLQAQALKTVIDIGQTRLLLFAQKGSTISIPFLVVVIFWLTTIFASFGILAPRNALVFVTLFVCALSVSGALFLILELDRPFEGLIRIPSEPLRDALQQLGR
jgi:hypothetical protein